MSNYTQALSQILTAMSNTFGVPARREVQAARQNWRDRIEQGDLPIPFTLLNLERMERVLDGPSTNRFRLDATIVYVCSQSMGSDQAGDVMSKLVACWSALYTYTSPKFNLEDEGTVFDVSGESEVMRAILDGSTALVGGELKVALTLDLSPA